MRPIIGAAIVASLLGISADAQPLTANAALRYWMAFALLQDPPADRATADLLQRVADGSVPWDESRLGTILDANADALDVMRRGSTLRACDWGVEYELGTNAPIAHLAKARVLGRLNVLSGMRLAARGRVGDAVDAWLTGVQFSQHIAQGGTVISALTANSVLIPSLNALAAAASRPQLDSDHSRRIESVVRGLPETGFDWPDAMRREGEVLAASVRLNAVPDLRAHDLDNLRTTVTRLSDALRLPPDQARIALATIDVSSLPLPSPRRINEARETVRAARQKVLTVLPKGR